MTARLLGTWADRSPEWLAARQHTVGGSEVGVIMGFSPFSTREQLMQQKLGVAEPLPMTDAMERGIYLEDGVRRWLLDKHGWELDPVRSNGMWVDSDNEHYSYNADGMTMTDQLLEIKVPRERSAEHGWGRAGAKSDQVPLTYAAQAIWGLGLWGVEYCHFGTLSANPWGFAQYRVKFDQKKYDKLRFAADEFLSELEELRAIMNVPESEE